VFWTKRSETICPAQLRPIYTATTKQQSGVPSSGAGCGEYKDEFESSGEVPPYLSLIMLALDTKDFIIKIHSRSSRLCFDCGKRLVIILVTILRILVCRLQSARQNYHGKTPSGKDTKDSPPIASSLIKCQREILETTKDSWPPLPTPPFPSSTSRIGSVTWFASQPHTMKRY